jgi:hypothetical protein
MTVSPTTPLSHRQAVDDTILAYSDWREERAAVRTVCGR